MMRAQTKKPAPRGPGSGLPQTSDPAGLAAGTKTGYFEEIRKVVLRIPRGRVATYGSVARAAGHPGTARQVGWALRSAGSRALPWQRVLGSGGRILLTGEDGLQQRLLLEIEGVRFKGSRVDMRTCEYRFPVKRPRRRIA